MKRFFVLCAAVAAFTTAIAQESEKKGPQISFQETNHNFGIFDSDHGQQTCHFVFTNTGDETLIISDAAASCGCTVPKYPKTGIEPGCKDSIQVTYNGTGRRPGVFRKTVTVYYNSKDPNNNVARIYIDGEMTESPAKQE